MGHEKAGGNSGPGKAGPPARGGKKPGKAGKAGGPYHHGNLRQALVEGGLSLLAREGPAAFSLRALAQELGVSHSAPYRHFASRDALLAAIVGECRSRMAEELKRSIAVPKLAGASALERIYVLGETFVRFYVANPEIHYLFNILPGELASRGGGAESTRLPRAWRPAGSDLRSPARDGGRSSRFLSGPLRSGHPPRLLGQGLRARLDPGGPT